MPINRSVNTAAILRAAEIFIVMEIHVAVNLERVSDHGTGDVGITIKRDVGVRGIKIADECRAAVHFNLITVVLPVDDAVGSIAAAVQEALAVQLGVLRAEIQDQFGIRGDLNGGLGVHADALLRINHHGAIGDQQIVFTVHLIGGRRFIINGAAKSVEHAVAGGRQ